MFLYFPSERNILMRFAFVYVQVVFVDICIYGHSYVCYYVDKRKWVRSLDAHLSGSSGKQRILHKHINWPIRYRRGERGDTAERTGLQ